MNSVSCWITPNIKTKWRKGNNVVPGNSFTADRHKNAIVRFVLMNPPFGGLEEGEGACRTTPAI